MFSNRTIRVRPALAAAAIGLVALPTLALISSTPGGAVPDASAATPSAFTASTNGAHVESTTVGSDASVSGDGNRIVFVAPSATTPPGQSTTPDSIWLRDRAAGTLTELISPNPALRSGASRHPVISRDGCNVVIVTELAFDLFRDDDDGARWDVYRTVLPNCPGTFETGQWQLVSTTSDAEPVARDDVAADQSPAVSGSGSKVVFARRAVPGAGDRADWTSLEVVDVTIPLGVTGRVVTAPGLPTTLAPDELRPIGQRDPSISDDGKFVAFTTDAIIESRLDLATDTEVVDATWPAVSAGAAKVTSPTTQVYRWDTDPSADEAAPSLRLVSADPNGVAGRTSSGHASVTALGDLVAFSSIADDLDRAANDLPAPTGAAIGASQIYVADLDPTQPLSSPDKPAEAVVRTVTLISRSATAMGNGPSSSPTLDAGGDSVIFTTTADNLNSLAARRSATGDVGDVVLANLVTGTLERITVRPDGTAADLGARQPRVSATARTIVFGSVNAAQLVGDTEIPSGAQIVSVQRDPQLDVTPVDVGTVAIGLPSAEWRTTIVNNGPGAFVPATIESSDPAFHISGGTCVAHVALPAGASCDIDVIFTPAIDGAASAAITLSEGRSNGLEVTAFVSGTGGTPTIVSDPSSQTLGSGIVGVRSANEATITLTNIGPFEEHLISVVRSGADTDDFPIRRDGCTGMVLVSGGYCQVTVGFAATQSGRRNAIVTISSEGGATTSAVVAGTGEYHPGIVAGPDTVGQRDQVTVSGLGFPADTSLSVGWSDSAQRMSVATSANGAFSARLPVVSGTATGTHTIIVLDPAGRHEPLESDPIMVTATRRSIPLAPRRP